ncbi:hypothetical protein [Pseudolactococcus insecticola]|uniref:Uncharacterized protein n=1 Tax=Pseudolactococcus insecticola TaxID=2709158 RepID=A0A6A0BAG2_9LACT|nr:hypothetical protein [Lactococcus insecticola]GFH40817.1 hypothetical protein Hs20B_12150 [Lactococcus insecticola]
MLKNEVIQVNETNKIIVSDDKRILEVSPSKRTVIRNNGSTKTAEDKEQKALAIN